ncbi:MAG: amino acid adenylation domain-containing protein, partial [Cyanobacteria bacterium J06650_10]
LNEAAQAVKPGEVGEICVQSPYIALGYWQNEARSKQAFLNDPTGGNKRIYRTGDLGKVLPDGRLIHQGRKDFQVKIRGNRVEIGEVEAALLKLNRVKAATVIGNQDSAGSMRLVAYVIPETVIPETTAANNLHAELQAEPIADQRAEPIADLRAELTERLPDYMVPAGFIFLQAFPLTPNGKVNRLALPTPTPADFQASSTAYAAPRNALEKTLSNIWADVLSIEKVGIHDNFFELGGQSLLATQVIARIQLQCQILLPLATLFNTATVSALAQSIEKLNKHEQSIKHEQLNKHKQLNKQQTAQSSVLAFPTIPRRKHTLQNHQQAKHQNTTKLSFSQQRVWLFQQLEPHSTAYHMTRVLRLHGALNVSALHQTLRTILSRHEILRTRYVKAENGIPQQIVDSAEQALKAFDFQQIDLTTESSKEQHNHSLVTLLESASQQLFDLSRDLMLRVALVKVNEHEHVLQIVMHHIASDGWSMGVFMKELSTLYQSYENQSYENDPTDENNQADDATTLNPLRPLPIQYADFAQWQTQWLSGDRLSTQISYWQQQLKGAPQLLELPTDRPRPLQPSYKGTRFPFTLSKSLTARLKALSQQNSATLFMTLLSAFNILLSRYSGQTDIVVGSPIANRNRPELEGLIGFFANTLALRTDLSENPTFLTLLKRVRKTALDAYAHQDMPFEKLVETLQHERNLSYSPIFQVMFVLQNTPEIEQTLGDVRLQAESATETTAKFDLSLYLSEQDGKLDGRLEYSSDLYDEATIARMVTHFRVLLEAIAQTPDQPISTLPVLPPSERYQLLNGWNQTQQNVPTDQCIHQLFEAQVKRTPDAIALTFSEQSFCEQSFGEQSFTYQTLNERANQLAHHLQALTQNTNNTLAIGPDSMIGIALDRSPAMLIGLLAILKTGSSYVPLDPSYPKERLNYMVEHSGLSVLLTQTKHKDIFTTQPVTLVNVADPAINHAATHNPGSSATPHNLAYTIYTSGSTGKPKGVQIKHRAAVNFLYSMRQKPGLTQQDSLLAVTTISFDIAVLELYLPLMVGARVVLASQSVVSDAQQLADLLTRSKATVMQATPATWQMLLAGGWKGATEEHTTNQQRGQQKDQQKLRSLKMLCGGEALPRDLANQLLERGQSLWNMYGPTEATVWTAACEIKAGTEPVPVAGPVANTQLYIVETNATNAENSQETTKNQTTETQTTQLRPAPIGIPGEVLIAGEGLARGYLNRPDLTAERFIADPFSNSSKAHSSDARLYRTGDLARFRPDGSLEFLGRIDSQVKVRGFRIELGEIESALSQHRSVHQSVVIVREDIPGDKRIIAYWTADSNRNNNSNSLEGVAEEFRTFLKRSLPDYMIPAAFVLLPSLPLTPNGKVNRRELPKPSIADLQAPTTYVAPRNQLEQQLVEIWQDVLNLDKIGIHDSFFELGGHSLLAAQVISRIQTICQLTLPLSHLFETPTIAELAAGSRDFHSQETRLPIRVRAKTDRGIDLAQLSFAQQRLWLLHQLEPENNSYHMTRTFRLCGKLNVKALEQAFTTIVERHEALRTYFVEVDGTPWQAIAPAKPFKLKHIELTHTELTHIELTHIKLAKAPNALQSQLETEAYRPFDLSGDLMLRATLIQLDEQVHILQFVMHHIASDGWSRGVFTQELTTLYNAYVAGQANPLNPLPIQYADFSQWQREWLSGDRLTKQLTYWEQQLKGAPPLLELPTDYPRPLQPSYQGKRVSFTLPDTLAEKLRTLSKQQGVTLFMTLHAAFNILLYRYSGQTDIVVGSPIANRPQKELEPLIGLFLNTLVLRTDLSEEPTFLELLSRVKQTDLDAYAHQNLPFEQLLESLQPSRDLSYSPWFQVLFVLQNTPQVEQTFTGLDVQKESIRKPTAKFDLTLSMSERVTNTPETTDTPITEPVITELRGVLEYSTDLFETETAKRMVSHFQTLLEGIVENPTEKIAALPLLNISERQSLLQIGTQHQASYPKDVCIHQLFEVQAEKTPGAIALISPDRSQQLTYQTLNERANQLAHHLQSLGVQPDTLVGLCLNRSTNLFIALLAILKAGGAYVPLDPNYPAERLALMVNDAQPQVIITDNETEHSLQDALANISVPNEVSLVNLSLVNLNRDHNNIAQQSTQNLESIHHSSQLAYVIYTSGSTGKPKGVMIEHRSLVNFTCAATDKYEISERDRVLQFASINFDAAAEEIFPALCCGATLVLRTDEMLSSASHFITECDALSLTVLDLPTAYWHQLATELPNTNIALPPALRLIIIGGEAAQPDQLQNWQAWAKNRSKNATTPTILNTYGPTEATIVTTYHPLPTSPNLLNSPRHSSTPHTPPDIPIGQSLPNITTYLLDAHLQPVPTGIPGELHIGGSGLARGYLNRPDLTAKRFISDPFGSDPAARLYKTGDLACLLPNGNLKFLGRLDDQVKIRGFRIELGEVESVIAAHPAIQQCTVIAREDHPGNKRLVGYLITDTDNIPTNRELRQFLQQQLPSYMVPSAFVSLAEFPLTPNNKIDRKALPKPDESTIQSRAPFITPQTPLEQQLTDIWKDVLNLSQISIHDNFFELGGHSLLATQVVARIQTHCKIRVPLVLLFEATTIAALAEAISLDFKVSLETEHNNYLDTLPRRKTLGTVPLSLAQQRLWFLQQLEPENSAYHMLRILRLRGPLNVAALEQALNTLIERHEALRTRFVTVQDIPQQAIAHHTRFHLPITDLSTIPAESQASDLTAQLNQNAKHPFNLATDLMMRATLIKLNGQPNEQQHILQIVIHHIAADGWSIGVLTQELSKLYAAYNSGQPNPLSPLSVQYADFSEWQRQQLTASALSTQLGYWEKQLSGAPQLLEMPTDRPRTTQRSNKGTQISFHISLAVSTKIKALSQENGATLFMTLLAAFNVLLHRYSGQTDIMIGSPIANRPRKELEPLIGLFLNTLVLRTDLTGEPTFTQLLDRVKQTALGAYAHQDVPFEQLLETLKPERNLSYSPWFQVLFILQNTPQSTQHLADLSIQTEHIEKTTAKFDLTLSISEQIKGLKGTLEYSTELFNADTIERMIGHFQTLLEAIAHNPNTPINTLPLLTPTEKEQLLTISNQIEPNVKPAEPACIHQLFEAQVQKTPNAIALIHQNQSLTYQQLNEQANQLAHYLTTLGIGPDSLVGLCLNRSLDMFIGLFAILKSGGAYVPLDPTYPSERLAMMVEDARPHAIITVKSVRASLPDIDIPLIYLDAAQRPAEINNNHAATDVADHNLAYVIYTSGSTGKPKGVMIEHRALVNFVKAAIAQYHITPQDRVLQFASINFDAAAEEIFPALCTGATLVLRTDEMLSSPSHFITECDQLGLTVLDLPTAYWHQLATELPNTNSSLPSALRIIIIGGEAAQPEQLQNWQSWAQKAQSFPSQTQPTILNTYGPTEATVVATTYPLPTATATDIPIGKPLPHTQTYVLDRALQPVPIGIPGELYIGGDSLARGYLNRPNLTSERFIKHPFSSKPQDRLYKTGDLVSWLPSGNLKFLGRQDDQVKIRGFRIELGEIETALAQHPAIEQSIVITREDTPGDKRLVSYITLHTTDTITLTNQALRAFLQQQLPSYMVPSAFVQLSAFPLTPNNKIDRKALPAPTLKDLRDNDHFTAPRSELEQQLARIWCDLLALEKISIHDNFFDLGGHSLLAAQAIARIQTTCQITLPLAALFETPTVAALSVQCQLSSQLSAQPSDATSESTSETSLAAQDDKDNLLVLLQQGSTEQPLFLIHEADGDISLYGHLASSLGNNRAIYAVKPRARNGFPMAYSRIEDIAADYRQQIQSVQPHGPYLLGGLCIGGVLAFEIALQLEEQGEKVALVALLDSITRGAKKHSHHQTKNRRKRVKSQKLEIAFQIIKQDLRQNPIKLLTLPQKVARKAKNKALQKVSIKTNSWQTQQFRQHYDGAHKPAPRLLRTLSVRQILVFAVQDYYPRAKLKGQALLIKASLAATPGKPAYTDMYIDPQFGWGKRVHNPIELHQVSGGHNSMLGAKKINEVASIIARSIDKSGIDKSGIDKSGIDKSGIDKSGIDKSGIDKSGIDKSIDAETSSKHHSKKP